LTTEGSYSFGTGKGIFGSDAFPPSPIVSQSYSFDATASARLTDVYVAIYYTSFSRINGNFDLTLTDSSNAVVESWTGLSAPYFSGNGPNPTVSVIDVKSASSPLLTAGQDYTMTASKANSTTFVIWTSYPAGLNSTPSDYNDLGFDVVGTHAIVPEPASIVLVAMGIVGC
jgi:hypothetical protein